MKRSDHSKARLNSGMTLIELLVVVAILGLLGVAVLPTLTGNRENQSNRAAAQQVSGLLNQSRNDAIAVGRPGGMTIQINELDLARCRVPPPYRGSSSTSKLNFAFGPPTLTPNAAGDISNILTAGVQGGDLISFDGYGGPFLIRPVPPATIPAITTSGFEILLIGPAATTPWPPTGEPMAFAIERQPRVVGTTISLANEACVDLTWSGFGSESDYTTFATAIGSLSPVVPVSIVFGEAGAVDGLIINGERVTPTGPICLLVARTDRRNNAYAASAGPSAADDSIGLNWQYPTSYWVVINNTDGQVRLAEAAPIEMPGDGFDNDSDGVVDELIEIPGNGIDDDGDTVVDELQEVLSSQRWAREAMTAGGL